MKKTKDCRFTFNKKGNKKTMSKLVEDTLQNISRMSQKEKEIFCVYLTRSMYDSHSSLRIDEIEKQRKKRKKRKKRRKSHQKLVRRPTIYEAL
jgi:hypothetical protein